MPSILVKLDYMADPHVLNNKLIDTLLTRGALSNGYIEQAFRNTLRHYFLPGKDLAAIYSNEAVVTSWSEDGKEPTSSSSQPEVMATMLDYMDAQPGQRVLEIGTGTGYNAALLASIVGSPPNVHSVDLVPEIVAQAAKNLESQGTFGIHFHCSDGWQGWPGGALYDSIIVTASSYDVAPAWFEQLRDGGRLVFPLEISTGNDRAVAFTKSGDTLELSHHSRCGFMRMRGGYDTRVVNAIAAHARAIRRQNIEVETVPPDSNPNWSDLAFFLSLYIWPRIVTVSNPENDVNRKFIMTADRDFGRQTLLECQSGWRIHNSASEAEAQQLKSLLHLWYEAGKPSPARLHLTAYPIPTKQGEAKEEHVFRRKWFEYSVSWDRAF